MTVDIYKCQHCGEIINEGKRVYLVENNNNYGYKAYYTCCSKYCAEELKKGILEQMLLEVERFQLSEIVEDIW